jgi:type II secretory pathway component PulF
MPRFSWRGVTLDGSMHRGTTCAISAEKLDEQLLQRGIAATSVTESKSWFVRKSVSYADQVALFAQLATLLEAGVRVPDAFILVAQYSEHAYLQEYVHDIGTTLQYGSSLGDALEQNRAPFSDMVVSLLSVGYESGQLAQAIAALAKYLETVRRFYGQMRAALLMPLITLLFVVCLIVGIFVGIVPYLSGLFASFNVPLPASTQTMLTISAAMRTWYMLLFLACGGILIIGFWQYAKRSSRLKLRFDQILARTPFIGKAFCEWQLITYMRALLCFLEGGMNIHQALGLVQRLTHKGILHADARFIADAVGGGATLSSALTATTSGIFKPDLVAMVLVGEESNSIIALLGTITTIYHERLTVRLNRITTLMQPLMVIILGLIVLILVVTVYMPIMQMAQCV